MILPPVLSLLAGLLVGSLFPYLPCSISILMIGVGLAVTRWERRGRITVPHGLLLFGSLILGIVWWNGTVWWQGRHDLAQWFDRSPVHVEGTVREQAQRTHDRLVVTIDVARVQEESAWVPASGRLLVTWRTPEYMLYPGDVVHMFVHIRPPYGTLNLGGFDYAAYLSRKGVHAVASLSDTSRVTIHTEKQASLERRVWGMIDRWRGQIQDAAARTLQGPALGLFLAVVIGEQGFVSPEIRDIFTATGTAHIVAISGTHLGLIAILTFCIVRESLRRMPLTWLERMSLWVTPTRLAAVVTVPMVLMYALLAGAKIATIRALIMILFSMAAIWMGRERHLLTVLAIAACVLLVRDPQSLYDVSFQLSFVAVLAIVMLLQWQQQVRLTEWDENKSAENMTIPWRVWRERMKQTMMVSLVVTAATLPLVAYHFNQLAWLGPLANLFVVPFVGIVVIPLGLLSALWTVLTGAEVLPFAMILQTVLDALIHGIRFVSEIPGADWHVASPELAGLVAFYVLMGTAMREKSPWFWRAVGFGGMAVLAIWWAWSPRLGWNEDSLRVTFLDIGQGDAVVVELPDGQVVVIDGGPVYARLDMGRAVIGPYLWDRGIRRIDHVIATHPQWDHIGGLAWLVRHFEVGRFWTNGIERPNHFYVRVKQAVRQMELREERAWAGREITRAGPCRLMVVNPPAPNDEQDVLSVASRSGSVLNNHSVVTRLDCGLHSFLFTADAEREALWRLSRMPKARTARVVKVPHHGAKSSLEREWIERLTAEIAVITVGRRNRYGHPVPEVVEAYVQQGLHIYRTDRDGAVWITANVDDPQYVVHTAWDRVLRPVKPGESMFYVEVENWSRLWGQWMGDL